MELKRARQRRKLRRLIENETLDLDVVNLAALELGLSVVIDDYSRPVKMPKRRPLLPGSDGAVYVIRGPSGLYKIGATANPRNRLAGLQTASADRLQLVHTIQTKQYTHFALERKIHQRLAAKRVRGEWFSLDADDVAALCAL